MIRRAVLDHLDAPLPRPDIVSDIRLKFDVVRDGKANVDWRGEKQRAQFELLKGNVNTGHGYDRPKQWQNGLCNHTEKTRNGHARPLSMLASFMCIAHHLVVVMHLTTGKPSQAVKLLSHVSVSRTVRPS